MFNILIVTVVYVYNCLFKCFHMLLLKVNWLKPR